MATDRFRELEAMVELLQPLVVSLNETYLQEGDDLREYQLPGYTLFTALRPAGTKRRAGVALYVLESADPVLVDYPRLPRGEKPPPGFLVSVHLRRYDLFVSSLYLVPAGATFDAHDLDLLLASVPEVDGPQLLLGDLNLHLLEASEPRPPAHKRVVAEWLVERGLLVAEPDDAGAYSYFQGDARTLVDYAAVSHHYFLGAEAHYLVGIPHGADHVPLLLAGVVVDEPVEPVSTPPSSTSTPSTRSSSPSPPQSPPASDAAAPAAPAVPAAADEPLRIPRKLKAYQIDRFHAELNAVVRWLEEQPLVERSAAATNALFEEFADRLDQALRQAFPPKRRPPTATTTSGHRPRARLPRSPLIERLIELRDEAYRAWVTCQTDHAWYELKSARRAAKREIEAHRRRTLAQKVAALVRQRAQLRTIMELARPRTRPPVLVSADAYSDHLMGIIAPIRDPHAHLQPPLPDGHDPRALLRLLHEQLTVDALQDTVKGLPDGKAVDAFGLHAELLKMAGEKGVDLVRRVLLLVAASGHVPAYLLRARVVPVPKTALPTEDPQDYRPISVIPVLRRVLEALLRPHVVPPILDALHPRQFGFKPDTSTLDAVLIASDFIEMKKGYASMAMLDVRAAYDTAEHGRIGERLRELQAIPSAARDALLQLLPSQAVISGPDGTAVIYATRGVPQGSTLSPFMYNLFIDPLLAQTVRLFPDVCTCYFADDQAVLGARPEQLQEALEVAELFAIENGYRYNSKKSVVLPGRPDQYARASKDPLAPHRVIPALQPGDLTVHGAPVPLTDKALYLGIPFVAGEGIDAAALARKNAVSAQRASSAVFALRSGGVTDVALLKLVYTTYSRPCFYYGCQVAGYSASQLQLMQKVENRVMRTILGAPKSASVDAMAALLRLPRVLDQVRYLEARFAVRLAELPLDNPTRASAELSKSRLRGRGRHLLRLGEDILRGRSKAPARPKDSEEYWRELLAGSGSEAARCLAHILPSKGAMFKAVLAVDGAAGWALRMWLLHRFHPDAERRCNPDFLAEASVELKVALTEVATTAKVALAQYAVRYSNPTVVLDPVSRLVRDVLHADAEVVKDKAALLTKVGELLVPWRAALRTRVLAAGTSTTSTATSSSSTSTSSGS